MLEGCGAVLQRVNLGRLASSLRLLSDELLNVVRGDMPWSENAARVRNVLPVRLRCSQTADDLKQMQWPTRLRIYPALFEAVSSVMRARTMLVAQRARMTKWHFGRSTIARWMWASSSVR